MTPSQSLPHSLGSRRALAPANAAGSYQKSSTISRRRGTQFGSLLWIALKHLIFCKWDVLFSQVNTALPPVITRILLFTHLQQRTWVKVNNCCSSTFSMTNAWDRSGAGLKSCHVVTVCPSLHQDLEEYWDWLPYWWSQSWLCILCWWHKLGVPQQIFKAAWCYPHVRPGLWRTVSPFPLMSVHPSPNQRLCWCQRRSWIWQRYLPSLSMTASFPLFTRSNIWDTPWPALELWKLTVLPGGAYFARGVLTSGMHYTTSTPERCSLPIRPTAMTGMGREPALGSLCQVHR